MNTNLLKVKLNAEDIARELKKENPNKRRISALKQNFWRWGMYYRQESKK